MPHTHSRQHSRQHGAVLVVSLLILLVLTIIGVAGLNTSVMEERMAANNQKLTETFQTAESAIQSTILEYADKPKALDEKAQLNAVSDRQISYNLGSNATARATVNFVGEVMVKNNSLTLAEPDDSGTSTGDGIEIVGTSTIANTNIASTTIQGYSIAPVAR